jgi:hypothetical protein
MKGINYKHANTKLLGGRPDIYDLPIARFEYSDGQRAVESCWKMTLGERLRALFLGKIYFQCWGNTHPPILLSTASAMDKFFEFKVWRFKIHNREQYDLERKPLICINWIYDKGNGCRRIFCL